MQNRVKILGVSVDKIKFEQLFSKTLVYMNKESFHNIYFVGMNTVFLVEKEKAFVEFLEQCDFVIVSEPTMEQKVYEDKKVLKSEKKLLAQRYIEKLLIRMNKNKFTLYLVGDDEEEIEKISLSISQNYSSISCFKSCIEDETKEDAIDFIVNDINSVAPDVMFILMNGIKAMEFIQENRSRMNVKLCLCIGEAKQEILSEKGIEVPNWVKRFHLEKIYQVVFHKTSFTQTISKKILQNKIKKEEMEEK